jgi:hypothetical protein
MVRMPLIHYELLFFSKLVSFGALRRMQDLMFPSTLPKGSRIYLGSVIIIFNHRLEIMDFSW